MKSIFFILLLFTGLTVSAQQNISISGAVKDKNGAALPGAIVFLSNTKYMTSADAQGNYHLSLSDPGSYEMVVKMIGFVPLIAKINIGKNGGILNVRLIEDNKALSEVTVNASRNNSRVKVQNNDPNYPRYLSLFIKYFIGASPNAEYCKILNPEVLRFYYDTKTNVLEANTEQLLQIENNGLGYKLNYLVTRFRCDIDDKIFAYQGYPYFEDLKGTEDQRKKWEQNRSISYRGSQMDFFRSVYNGTAGKKGFAVYTTYKKSTSKKAVDIDSLFLPAKNGYLQLSAYYNKITAEDTIALYVFYKGSAEHYSFTNSGYKLRSPVSINEAAQLSKLRPLVDTITIDANGTIIPNQAFLTSGYWAWKKIAELLPIDYQDSKVEAHAGLTQASTDTSLAGRITTALKTYSQNNDATSKLFLQFDKQNYNPGDTLWFKAYNLTDDGLANQDRILITELINNKDSVVSRMTLKLEPAVTWGDIPLSDELNPAAYRIRAYIKSSSGNLAGNFFGQPVNIGVRILDNSKELMPVNAKFYAEGGALTVGLRSKIAIKVVDSYGYGKVVNGVITDDDNNELASFATGHGGIGVFALTPVAGKKYKAVVTTANRRKLLFDLPPAAPAGFSLAINNQLNDSIYVKVAANNELLKSQAERTFYVVGQHGDEIVYTAKGAFNNAAMTMHVAKNVLPSGVLQFTVFTENGKPLNSRMIFNENADTLNVITDHQLQQPLNILVKDRDGKPVNGSFGVAVTREPVNMPDIAENDIMAYMQLTGELKNPVEKPEYYFDKKNQDAKAAMDMLLITQENKKYNWRDITTQNANQAVVNEENSLSLEGFVKDKKQQPLPGAKVWVYCLAQRLQRDTVTDANGHFKFNDLDLADTATLIVKATSKITRKINIYLKEAGYPAVAKASNGIVNPNGLELIDDTAKKMAAIVPTNLTADTEKVYKALKQVDIRSTRIAEPAFFNNYNMTPSYTLQADLLNNNGPNLAVALASKIPGAVYINGILLATHPTRRFVIVIDGHVIPDGQQLSYYVGPEDVENVKMLEGVTPPNITGTDNGPIRPILLITTKRYAGTAPPEGRDLKTVELATDTSGKSVIVTAQPKKVLKTVNVKAKKTSHDDESNNYGAAQPYTISGDVFRDLGSSTRIGLAMKAPMAFLNRNGVVVHTSNRPKDKRAPVPFYIVVNNHEVPNNDIDIDANVGTADIEDVRVLHGMQYMSVYGVQDRYGMENSDILLITTKQYLGIAKPETRQMKTIALSAGDTTRKMLLTNGNKKTKVLKEVDVKSQKNKQGDIAPGAYTLKGDVLKDLGPSLTQVLSMKLPNVRVVYDKEEAVNYLASFTSTPATIDNPMPVYPRLHVVINNSELLPPLSIDSYLNPEDVEEVKVLHGAMYKSMFAIAIDPKLYDMDDILLIKTKPSFQNRLALKKTSQIQNESYITTADPSPILTYKFNGYSRVHDFHPTANMTQAGNLNQPKTVFWQPNMITDADGKLTIKLDDKSKGTYRVTVQGVDSYGRTGRLVYTYKVE